MPKAREAAETALRLDDSLADAHTSLGLVLMWYDWKWADAEKEFRLALERNPGYAAAHDGYATLLAALGRNAEWPRESLQARSLDPLSPMFPGDAGWNFILSRQPGEAVPVLRRAIELEPAYGIAHALLGIAYAQLGSAIGSTRGGAQGVRGRRQPAHPGHRRGSDRHGGRLGRSPGDPRASRRRLADALRLPLRGRRDPPVLGEKDEAFRWLEKAYEVRSACMPL